MKKTMKREDWQMKEGEDHEDEGRTKERVYSHLPNQNKPFSRN
jgi:hypothetical protein